MSLIRREELASTNYMCGVIDSSGGPVAALVICTAKSRARHEVLLEPMRFLGEQAL